MNSERMEEYEILEETPAKQEKKVRTEIDYFLKFYDMKSRKKKS